MIMMPATRACELQNLSTSDYLAVIKHYNGGAAQLSGGLHMVDYDKFCAVVWQIRHPFKCFLIDALDIIERTINAISGRRYI